MKGATGGAITPPNARRGHPPPPPAGGGAGGGPRPAAARWARAPASRVSPSPSSSAELARCPPRRGRARPRRTGRPKTCDYRTDMPVHNRAATNQAPPLEGYDVVASDPALVEAISRHADPGVVHELAALGELAGSAEAREHAMLANRNEPVLETFDRYGNRIDEVRFHP